MKSRYIKFVFTAITICVVWFLGESIFDRKNQTTLRGNTEVATSRFWHYTSKGIAFADVKVKGHDRKGYYRKDGTYVKPTHVQEHYRSDPDGNVDNNWSTYPNINPHTGKQGTKYKNSLPSDESSISFPGAKNLNENKDSLITCPYCNGQDLTQEICQYCNGRDLTREICQYCNGRDLTQETCSYCNGRDLTREICSYCKGNNVNCVMCSGTGHKDRCVMCSGMGHKDRCVMCGGTGHKDSCVMCGGTGKMSNR